MLGFSPPHVLRCRATYFIFHCLRDRNNGGMTKKKKWLIIWPKLMSPITFISCDGKAARRPIHSLPRI